ncbi:MAG: hypothetical protein WC367_01970 [Methanoregula sp.]
MKRRDAGVSELTDEFLLIGLLVAIAIIILAISFGLFGFLQKSAYMVPDFSFKNISGHSAIAVFHRAGDPVYFTDTTTDSFQAGFYVDTITGTYPVKPVPSLTNFGPGQTIYIYYTGSGFAAATNLSGVTFPSLPPGIINLRLVDLKTHVLIAQMNTTVGAGTGTATTANITTTATTTVVTTNATTLPTPASYALKVSWTPKGSGANALGTISPPGTNDATVNVLTGASQTFTFVPASGYRVQFIRVDGVQVSSGGAVNQVLTYTLTNVQSAHTISAHFG